MKYNIALIIGLIGILGCASIAHAEIIQGQATSNTSVTTNIQGSGQVHTYIRSTVNGQTKTVEGDKPGTYILNNSSSGSTSSSKSTVTITTPLTQTPTPTPTVSATPTPTKGQSYTYMKLFTSIRLFFHKEIQQLLFFFHL